MVDEFVGVIEVSALRGWSLEFADWSLEIGDWMDVVALMGAGDLIRWDVDEWWCMRLAWRYSSTFRYGALIRLDFGI